jgi:hypothetical protein
VDVLLSRGAHVHQKNLYGQTALHFAASKWWRSDVFRRIFYEAGPRAMNISDCDGSTPLHRLAYFGSAEQMAFVLSHPGIDMSTRDRYGRTPLDVWSHFRPAIQTYREQEARWQPLRYTWIKFTDDTRFCHIGRFFTRTLSGILYRGGISDVGVRASIINQGLVPEPTSTNCRGRQGLHVALSPYLRR